MNSYGYGGTNAHCILESTTQGTPEQSGDVAIKSAVLISSSPGVDGATSGHGDDSTALTYSLGASLCRRPSSKTELCSSITVGKDNTLQLLLITAKSQASLYKAIENIAI